MPKSLRARLTLTYAVLTGILLTLAGAVLMAVVAAIGVRFEGFALDEATEATRTIVQAHWFDPDAAIIALVAQQAPRPGVRIITREGRVFPDPFGGPPGFAARRFGGPGFGAPFVIGAGPGPFDGPVVRVGRPPAEPGFSVRVLLSSLGLRTQPIALHLGEVLVVPDLDEIGNLARLFVAGAIGLVLLAAIISWVVARWITDQAIAPLTAVTRELRRFASGDFTSRPVRSDDRSELGELIAAYNGAVAQVAAAFTQRAQSEQHMRMLLGEAGHEMRTPLTAISAYIEVLEKNPTVDAATRERAFTTLRAETRRLRDLVERVMALARLDASERGDAGPVDVVDAVRDAIEQLTAVRPGEVRVVTDPTDAIVLAQPWELHEAVGNLIDNALKYGGGTPVEVQVTHARDSVIVRVSDGGPGISPAERERLFRHFFRGEQADGIPGSGLGLAIVARAAQRLGGDVTLERSVPGEGTTFRLTLPAFRAAATLAGLETLPVRRTVPQRVEA